jgi:L-ascorbate metabolism protein UlaG (beta-lactamase superfamily)
VPPTRRRLPSPLAFGADPSGARLARIRRSPHFDPAKGVFINPEGPAGETTGGAPAPDRKELLRSYLRSEDRARRAPSGVLPVHPTSIADLARPPRGGLRVTWAGHSSVLTEIDGARVLFDPVWGERCSPFSFAGPRRLHPAPFPLSAIGHVDAVVISHDHYDHLDLPSVRALAARGTVFVVPLGIGAHLERWGVPDALVQELDWHESTELAGVRLTATPARHFCGRGLRNTQHTLWASWVVAGPEHRVFHSGDTGYFPGFAEIGRAHGPFDLTMIQLGAYSEYWPDIHMTPAEALRAHEDLGGGVLLPIHWGTFNLAPHPWAEPAEWTKDLGDTAGTRIAFPRPGQPFEPAGELPAEPWWRAVSLPLERHWDTAVTVGRGPGAEPTQGPPLDLAADR